MSPGRRGGPEPKLETAQDEVAAAVLTIVPPTTDTSQSPDPAAALGTTFVVVVTVDDDHQRRRTYFNLPSAQRAADRAQARGQRAEVVLCALKPVGVGAAEVTR